MRLFRTYWFTRVLGFYLLLSFVNISIDPPDLLSNLDADIALEEDLNLNEMESISELVLEQVMDISNAVPESDENESEIAIKKIEINPSHQGLAIVSEGNILEFKNSHVLVSIAIIVRKETPLTQPPPFQIHS